MSDTEQLLQDLRLGRISATRLSQDRGTALDQLLDRAQARVDAAKPWTIEDLFDGFVQIGYFPGGIYLPSDPDREAEVRQRLRQLGEIEDDQQRELAYQKLQRETEQMERQRVAGRWTWQQAGARSLARFKIFRWGRRGGKTFYAARVACSRAIKRPRSVIWVAAKTDDAVSRAFTMIADVLEARGFRSGARRWANAEDSRYIELDNGSVIMGISLGGELSAAGTGVDLLILDEAEYATDDDWKKKCMPTLLDKLGEALIISSAQEGDETWFNQRVEQALASNDPEWVAFDMPSWENFYRFPQGRESKAIKQAEKEHADDPAGFMAIYGGKPSGERDRIFYAYKPKVHLVDDIQPNPWKPVVCVADPSGGINEYGVLVFQDYGDRVDVLEEYYRTGVTTEEVAAELDTRSWRYLVEAIYVDQGSNAMEIVRWANAGWPAAPITVEDKAGKIVPGKPDLDTSVPIGNNVFRNPLRFRQYQRRKMAVLLAEWGYSSMTELPADRRQAFAIDLEESLTDASLGVQDIEALQDCSGIRISKRGCPNFHKELMTYRKRRPRDATVQDSKIMPRKTADHLCDCFRYFCWVFRRHLWMPGEAQTYLEHDVPGGQGYQGQNWLESVRMALMNRRETGGSYLIAG